MKPALSITHLTVSIETKTIINDLSLTVHPGELHAIMGPNGSGKSTLAATLMGHPSFTVQQGEMAVCGETINDLSPDKRAKRGLFLAFQYPLEVAGARYADFLRQSYNAIHGGTDKQLGIKAFRVLLEEKMELLGIDPCLLERDLNFGFSGGEKKRAEVLQLAVLQPKVAILDEIDSGLDIDALKRVCAGLKTIREHQPEMAIVLITHYQRMLDYCTPDRVHIMQQGTITQSGDAKLAHRLEHAGYDRLETHDREN
jgi:Fe-S cluster assembly ATP-binding protein